VYFVLTGSDRDGTGTPLVCLHRFMDTWRVWELVLPELEPRVVAKDSSGHT
jgi:hypothetical protein